MLESDRAAAPSSDSCGRLVATLTHGAGASATQCGWQAGPVWQRYGAGAERAALRRWAKAQERGARGLMEQADGAGQGGGGALLGWPTGQRCWALVLGRGSAELG